MIARRQSDNPTRLSVTEQQILAAVAELKEAYGLQLTRHCKLRRGTVYVLLRRLTERGFVTSRVEPLPAGAVGPSRRLYTATVWGERALKAWAAAREAWECES